MPKMFDCDAVYNILANVGENETLLFTEHNKIQINFIPNYIKLNIIIFISHPSHSKHIV